MLIVDPTAGGPPQGTEAKAGSALPRYGFAVAIAVAIAVAVVALAKLSEFMAEARWVEHTHQVIGSLARLESAVVDAEAAERGHVLFGSDVYLDSFRGARRSADAALESLQRLLADNPEQLLRLDDVRVRAARELENLERIVRLMESGQRAAVSRSINAITDGERMRAVRQRLREMLDVEEALLARRIESAEQGAVIARVLVVIGTAVSLGLLLFAYVALQRENARRTASEAATREANAFLDRMFEAVPHILYVKSVPDFRYLRVNKAHEAMFEIPRERLVGKSDAELFAPPQAAQIAVEDQSTLAGTDVFEAGWDQLGSARRGGRTLHKKKVIIHDAGGQPAYLLGIAEDITEHKQAQLEIGRLNETLERRARELETTNRELESFSYSVSHDLRAPLRAINGFALMLAEDYGDKLDDEGRRLLGVVRSNAQRMGMLIDDLLAFSRIGRAALNRVVVDMNAMVATVLK
jgi:PAS domain S-box-containing protein